MTCSPATFWCALAASATQGASKEGSPTPVTGGDRDAAPAARPRLLQPGWRRPNAGPHTACQQRWHDRATLALRLPARLARAPGGALKCRKHCAGQRAQMQKTTSSPSSSSASRSACSASSTWRSARRVHSARAPPGSWAATPATSASTCAAAPRGGSFAGYPAGVSHACPLLCVARLLARTASPRQPGTHGGEGALTAAPPGACPGHAGAGSRRGAAWDPVACSRMQGLLFTGAAAAQARGLHTVNMLRWQFSGLKRKSASPFCARSKSNSPSAAPAAAVQAQTSARPLHTLSRANTCRGVGATPISLAFARTARPPRRKRCCTPPPPAVATLLQCFVSLHFHMAGR